MTRPRCPVGVVAVLAVTLAVFPPSWAEGQRGSGAPPFDGPRGVFTFELSDGEPVSFYLEWSRVLDITETQRSGLIDIRRRLRVQNAPFVRTLDSLREQAGVDLSTRGRLTERDREALERFQAWAAPVIDSIRVNNEGARREIRALLDARQRARADSIVQGLRDEAGRRRGARGGAPAPGGRSRALTRP